MKGDLLHSMGLKQRIIFLRDSRNAMIKRVEDSWDSEEMKYTLTEPKSVDILGEEILKLIREFHGDLEVDFVLETLSHLGWAPNLVYDDNGNWAISGDGFAPTVMTESGKFEENVSIEVLVEPIEWKPAIREALVEYLKD